MNDFSTILLSEYSILTCELDKIEFNSKCVINTINQYSYIIAENDEEFKSALSCSDILLPDGVGIVAAVKLLTGKFIKKIAGADMHSYLLNKLNAEGGSCFYLGSTDATLTLIKTKINLVFPNIKVGTYSPPFKQTFSNEDNDKIISTVNNFKPDVLFVGMTAPKQEKWTYKYQSQLEVTTICSIGAVFDFYAGTVTRPSKFWQNLGLEWFVRLVKEPRRMFKRYLYYGPIFVLSILRQKTDQFLVKRVTAPFK
jgi:N-acetylglucosaminyldiphosphoundecaprenol N-acetyl-beta-D-mannosaminyltransferase